MPPWSFVGRSRELTRLIDAAEAAPGRGLVFGGAAGIGKSRLLREGINALDADRMAVWWATATAATAGLPLGSLTPALPPDQPPGGTSVALLRWAVDALDRQAAGRPIIVAVDNAHLLDPLSAALVHYLARSERATILATVRTGEQVPDSVRALWTEDLVERIELEPLTLREATDLLVHVLGGPMDQTSIERLWILSQGNALLLRELVTAATATGEIVESFGVRRWTGHLELAPSLTEVVDARIGRLTPEVRTVLELVAFGEPIGLELITRAADAEAVETAEERALIRVVREGRRTTVRLAQPLYGEVVRQRCPVTRVRRHLETLAELVESAGSLRRDDLLRVAVWRLDSDTARDPRQLLAAAQQAFATFDVALATRLARAAMTLGGGLDAALLLAETLVCLGDTEEALSVLGSAEPLVTMESSRVRWLRTRAVCAYWGLGDTTAIAPLAEAAGDVLDPAHLSVILAAEGAMRLHHGEYGPAVTLARRVLDNPASSPASRTVAHSAMTYLQAVRGACDQAVSSLGDTDAKARTWQRGTPYVRVSVEVARGVASVLSGRLSAVESTTSGEFAGMVEAGDFRVGSGFLNIVRAQAYRLRGDLVAAGHSASQAAALLAGGRVFTGFAHAERAHAAALCGQNDVAASAMDEADRSQSKTTAMLYPWLEHARCWTAACAGRLDVAAGVTASLLERLRADQFQAHEVVALHDLVRLGLCDESVVDRLHALAATVEGPYAPVVARQAGALAERDGQRLLSAADGFARLSMMLYAAEAATAAVTLLRAARSPLTPQASQRLTELRQHCPDARTPGLSVRQPVLTGRERQIARLAAVGLSSKEIAEQLYLSSRTVDNHLMRVYAKLGVSGRTELAAALGILPYDQE